MNENRIGQFIAELRKGKNMTQKDLAAQLHITDKAVSKWERGLSCPDISLLSPLADILGITVSELLNAEKNESPSQDVLESVDHALIYAEKSSKKSIASFRHILTISFSALLLLGILACVICDVAISGALTWSWYPISSILFAWLVCVPIIKYGMKGIPGSLIAISLFILPFLTILSKLVGGNNLIMPIGTKTALPSIAYLWCIYFIFKKLALRKQLAAAVSFLLAIPLHLIINFVLADILSIPFLDVWDLLSLSGILLCAIALFLTDHIISLKKSAL
ncbi:MAG: helix-turn-helix domain-containing protein [Lachnospiraceae bacterium]|nr:helix-turn-helix domain-containing protein [Lachnospiraceae bacterium]MDE7240002.1 helix-turn-helix domain-containing protein [Lachnospiraceae bacterium]